MLNIKKILYTIAILVIIIISSENNRTYASAQGGCNETKFQSRNIKVKQLGNPTNISNKNNKPNNEVQVIRRFPGKWTEEEDNIIKNGVQNKNSWNEISKMLKNRKPREIRARWTGNLSVPEGEETWSIEQDILLREKINTFGTCWKLIGKFFPGRSETSLKNRWYSHARRPNKKELQYIAESKSKFEKQKIEEIQNVIDHTGLDASVVSHIWNSLEIEEAELIIKDKQISYEDNGQLIE